MRKIDQDSIDYGSLNQTAGQKRRPLFGHIKLLIWIVQNRELSFPVDTVLLNAWADVLIWRFLIMSMRSGWHVWFKKWTKSVSVLTQWLNNSLYLAHCIPCIHRDIIILECMMICQIKFVSQVWYQTFYAVYRMVHES